MFSASSSRRTSITLCISALALWPSSLPASASRPTTLVRPPWKHNLGFNKLRQFHVDAYGGPGHDIADPRGVAAVKLRFKDDDGPGDDDEVTVFGVNAGAREIVYNPSLVELAFYSGGGLFTDPVGIAADRYGMVVVGDRGADRVVVLRVDDRTRLRLVRTIELEASGRPLSRPAGVAIAEGRIYAADGGNDRVVAFDSTGAVAAEYGVGVLSNPFDVDVIGETWNREGIPALAVSDQDGGRLTRIELVGRARTHVDYRAVTGGSGGFSYVAFDYHGNVLVSDASNGCVYKFRDDLEFLARFECDGEKYDDLDSPRGIAVNRRLGQVFIAEETGASYYWVGTDVTGLSARVRTSGERMWIDVRFVLTERSFVSARLETEAGETVLTLEDDVCLAPGPQDNSYPVARSNLACGVADCEYRLTLRARATYASARHFEAVRSTEVRLP
jgi:DNA-binding beta-propeller fold protein YncE